MKKLRLANLNLETNDLLQREQLKTVFGGYGGGGNCFDDAISQLHQMEASIGDGVTFNDQEAAEWLNINYAACVCQEVYKPIASVELYDACWGF